MPQKRLLVDLDGTIARFHDEVNYMERMFEQGFFENLQPFENMVEGIRLFIQNNPDVPVYSCSAEVQSPYCREEKDAWLDRNLPEIPEENRIYTEIGRSKAEYLQGGVTKDDYLLDDYNRGLHKFLYDGGSAIKCHNNINQKGIGAHGGERGYMWEGPMVHAFDPPELIAAELAQLMGLEYDLKKAAEACGVQYNQPGRPIKTRSKSPFMTPVREKDNICYAVPGLKTNNPWTIRFQNPFNALRWLNYDSMACEYSLTTYDGHDLTASGYQLEAVCQNAYGSGDFISFMHADRAQLADDAKKAFDHRTQAIVGFISRLNPAGEDFNMTPFYDHRSMTEQIKRHEQLGETYHAEWFVEAKTPEYEQTKETLQSSFTNMLEDASRRAAKGQNGGSSGRRPEL